MTEIPYNNKKINKKIKPMVNCGESFQYLHIHVAYVYMCT